MTTDAYLENWSMFLEYICSLFESGQSENEISREFSGKRVIWEGCIADIKLEEEYTPGISLTMKPGAYPLSQGKILLADHLFLNIDENTIPTWQGCKVGKNIKFSGVIDKTAGPFPEIQLSEDKEDPEILLMIGLYECELISSN